MQHQILIGYTPGRGWGGYRFKCADGQGPCVQERANPHLIGCQERDTAPASLAEHAIIEQWLERNWDRLYLPQRGPEPDREWRTLSVEGETVTVVPDLHLVVVNRAEHTGFVESRCSFDPTWSNADIVGSHGEVYHATKDRTEAERVLTNYLAA